MSFKIIAGNFPKNASFDKTFGQATLNYGLFGGTHVKLNNNIESVEIVTEENKKKILGATGWGLAGGIVGGILTGGLGLLVGGAAGVLAGGNKKEVCFVCYLKDGKKFMAVSDPKTYQKIAALAF